MFKRRITSIIACCLVLIALLPGLAIAFISSRIADISLREGNAASLASLTAAISMEATRVVQPANRILRSLGLLLAASPDPGTLDLFVRCEQQTRPDITSLVVTDMKGRVLSLSPPDEGRKGYDYSGQSDFAEAISHKGTVLSEPRLSFDDGTVTVVAYRRMGDHVGMAFLDLASIGGFLSQLRLSPSDMIAVVDSKGRFIAHTDGRAVQEQRTAGRLPGPDPVLPEMVLDGRRFFIGMASIEGTDWRVVYYRDAWEAMRLARRISWGTSIVAGMATLLALLAAFAINRALSASFSSLLSRIRELSEGHYDRRVEGRLPEELTTIGEAFNHMADRVQTRDLDLQKSEERYRSLFFGSHVPALLFEPGTGAIRDTNRAARIFYGYDAEELLSLTVFDLNVLPQDEIRSEMRAAAAEKRNHFRFRHRLKGGEVRDVEVFSSPIEIESASFLYSIVFDVTERSTAEAQVKRALGEKEVLLKEVHHRVKNNLQIIASLLHMQEASVCDERDLALLTMSQSRVHSMALTHELLYNSSDYSSIEMSAYAERLLSYLCEAYCMSRTMVDVEMMETSLPPRAGPALRPPDDGAGNQFLQVRDARRR
jgi:PAS domain S-box-containing protein